jgi:ribosomal protein L37AE/L43A
MPIYRAIQRCPQCRSDDTTMSVGELPPSPQGHLIDAKWLCRTCKHVFAASNVHNHIPVLMCDTCREPRLHTHSHNAGGQEIYTCLMCGDNRAFGIAYGPIMPGSAAA